MNTRQLTFALPGNLPSVLTLPQQMAPETLPELACAIAAALGDLRRAMCDTGADPGQIEYASWQAQSGAARH